MEPDDHPAAVDLERFMRGELGRAEVRELVRHMLTGCPQCLVVTRRLWSLGQRSLHLLETVSAAGAGEGEGDLRFRGAT
jgi:hypothetical protein